MDHAIRASFCLVAVCFAGVDAFEIFSLFFGHMYNCNFRCGGLKTKVTVAGWCILSMLTTSAANCAARDGIHSSAQ